MIKILNCYWARQSRIPTTSENLPKKKKPSPVRYARHPATGSEFWLEFIAQRRPHWPLRFLRYSRVPPQPASTQPNLFHIYEFVLKTTVWARVFFLFVLLCVPFRFNFCSRRRRLLAVHPGASSSCSLVLKIHTPVIATGDQYRDMRMKTTATALNPTSEDGTGWEPNYYQLELEL